MHRSEGLPGRGGHAAVPAGAPRAAGPRAQGPSGLPRPAHAEPGHHHGLHRGEQPVHALAPAHRPGAGQDRQTDRRGRDPGLAGVLARAFVHPAAPPQPPLIVEAYRQHLAQVMAQAHIKHRMGPATPDLTRTDRLVLANMHLDAGSFVSDREGKLWVVGWGKGGFYAPEAEVAICTYLIPDCFTPIIAMLMDAWRHKRAQLLSLRAVARWLDERSAL
ncbi:hypothetical protein F4811DRAFT_570772 [Daldinia bambusicola]|nr:hypothetical protein F4811DRAFT_570772 [Daldinia bambusicola]